MAVLARVGSRLVVAAGLTLAVSALLFAAVEVMPGDAATAILGANATTERVEALRSELRLDESPVARYGDWVGGVLTGDLGHSITSGRPAWAVMATPLRNTLVLGGSAAVMMSGVAIVAGTAAGRRPGSTVDRTLTALASLAVSTPDFVLGTVLITIVASWLDLLPAVSLVTANESPWDARILVLPVATMSLAGGAYGARLVRAVVADATDSPHVEAARLAGLAERRVLARHLLPGVVGPIAQVIASLVPYAIGGAIVVERLFGYPGLGSLFVEQLGARDVVVVEAIGLLLTVVVVAALFLADAIGIVADPRARTPAALRAARSSASGGTSPAAPRTTRRTTERPS